MTQEEQLAEVKKSMNISGTALDGPLAVIIEDVKQYMINAGVPEKVANAESSIGVICKGTDDLYNYKQLSSYFDRRVIQLAMRGNTQ